MALMEAIKETELFCELPKFWEAFLHIINKSVLFEMNIAIIVYNDVVLHLIWFVNTVFIICFLLWLPGFS